MLAKNGLVILDLIMAMLGTIKMCVRSLKNGVVQSHRGAVDHKT